MLTPFEKSRDYRKLVLVMKIFGSLLVLILFIFLIAFLAPGLLIGVLDIFSK